MSKHWTQQTLAEELQEKVSDLEKQLESYQAARVHDVDEKAWLSKRMSAFEAVLREIAAGGWNDVIEPVALARSALTDSETEVKG